MVTLGRGESMQSSSPCRPLQANELDSDYACCDRGLLTFGDVCVVQLSLHKNYHTSSCWQSSIAFLSDLSLHETVARLRKVEIAINNAVLRAGADISMD